ncbi:SIS domain-containing protein [Dyadobacter sp. CY261]|uniref:sugar isomerase domain-containing protein n=1 Tax=Dyadobacter sp. CY261 TaxID=2907203 RepID=UPI001F3E08CA|nr:SIS domain-containing protein [Dyadobacter sp. CY261]MCF0069719.1 SIS domain-containing protein [Dyadobacter sp. CY261]
MSYTQDFLGKCQGLIAAVSQQEEKIQAVAKLFASSILAGRMVHIFGSGHSRIMVEEMWPRYGSFPGFNPIVELSLTFHNLVVGANGQRQAMFLENVSGFAKQILRNFDLSDQDSAIIISSSGCNVVPIELAELFQQQGIKTVGIISMEHSQVSTSKRQDGLKLQDFCDIVLDSGAPAGDAMVSIEGLDTPVAPGSTVGSCMLINCIKAELANLLVLAGAPPKVLTASALVGADRAAELFQAAYDEHAHRVSRLYKKVGIASYVSDQN